VGPRGGSRQGKARQGKTRQTTSRRQRRQQHLKIQVLADSGSSRNLRSTCIVDQGQVRGVLISMKVAVIGAGIAGLQQGRALQKRGVDFHIYEAEIGVGGVWRTTAHLQGAQGKHTCPTDQPAFDNTDFLPMRQVLCSPHLFCHRCNAYSSVAHILMRCSQ